MKILRAPVLSLCVFFVLLTSAMQAQTTSATVNGLVLDSSGAVVVGASVQAINDDTNLAHPTRTNSSGVYSLPSLPPGRYHIQVSKAGFKNLIKPDIILNVQDARAVNFTLQVGAASETVTVTAGAPLVNTQGASVSTVVDQTYIKNMPLNGRSFQDLILLTPGVVTNTPQAGPNQLGSGGEFSVNGQRTESNYYSVDGVSANTGLFAGDVQGGGVSGSVAASTALGTTQSLVSLDALEEFRIQSSTYSAEYGRNPGGQFAFETKAGTNLWHGSVYDYLRNGMFDAQDWFSNFFGTPQPELRQNDFGGTLGGPVRIPGVYNGKDRTFFFFSYEGLRLAQPQAATVTNVPSLDLRHNAPAALQPVLNGFPLPNNGDDEFIGTWSNPSQLDSTSIRFDHQIRDKHRLFFRFSDTSSSAASRGNASQIEPASLQTSDFTNRTYTLGATSALTPLLNNEFRVNFTSNSTSLSSKIDGFAGGTAVDLAQLQGIDKASNPAFAMTFSLPNATLLQSAQSGEQRQWNLVDTVSLSLGAHQLKFGFDYRRLAPIQRPVSPQVFYEYDADSSVLANTPDLAFAFTQARAYPLYTNFSAFVQDEWKIAPRLNVSMGVRWEVNPAPGARKGNLPYTVQGDSPATYTLAPQGTPLWETSWANFAPRLGIAYVARDKQDWETVVRGGGGVFFDTGQQLGSFGYLGDGFFSFAHLSDPFPAPVANVIPPIVNPPMPPYQSLYGFPRHLQLPYTLQWNASVQQALGKDQSATITYVGSAGRRLLQLRELSGGALNPNIAFLTTFQNALTSDYDSLQLQFQRRLSHGLTALASYTWSHSIDFGSQNFSFPSVRGNSNFDVRHNFSAAFSYDIPTQFENKAARALLKSWGIDDRFTARSGFPVNFAGPIFFDPASGAVSTAGLDLVPGKPIYVTECVSPLSTGPAQIPCPGGKGINPEAFAPPPGCTVFSCPGAVQGNAPRNFVRGFGAWQMNLAVRRDFPLGERLKLQFRAEAFNIFNHPNYGFINSTISNPLFGEATATLAQSSSVLSPTYSTGAARSLQFALKLTF